MIRLLPLNDSFLPNVAPVTSAGLNETWSCPLNQNGWPAASFSPAIFWPVGVMSGSMSPPRAGKSKEWKPTARNLTLSPLLIVMPCGKKSLTSDPVGWNAFWEAGGMPRLTVLVLASATPGRASRTPTPIAPAVRRLVISLLRPFARPAQALSDPIPARFGDASTANPTSGSAAQPERIGAREHVAVCGQDRRGAAVLAPVARLQPTTVSASPAGTGSSSSARIL